MEEKGIKHSRITSLRPQANSEAENFLKPVTKAIEAPHADGRDWQKDLYQFLLTYRATPHSTTGFAPSELLFNRKIKTKRPQISTKRNSDIDQTVQKNDERAKERMQIRDPEQESLIFELETLLIRQRKQNKWSTKFDPFPVVVVRRKGTMIMASSNGKYFLIMSPISRRLILDTLVRNLMILDILPEDNAETVPRNESPDPHRYLRRDRRPTRRYGQNVYEQ